MMLEVPHTLCQLHVHCQFARLRMQRHPAPRRLRQTPQPLAGPQPHRVDHRHESRKSRFYASIQPRIDEGVLVPQRQHRLVLRYRPTHPVHKYHLRIRQMPNQHPARPSTHPSLRPKATVCLLIVQAEQTPLDESGSPRITIDQVRDAEPCEFAQHTAGCLDPLDPVR